MKHNGNLKVAGRLSSKKIIVGDFSGTSVTSGSYELPYPIGKENDVLSVTTNISGNLVLKFDAIDSASITYSPSISGDWIPEIPLTNFEALDILASKITNHNHIVENLVTNETQIGYLLQPNGLGGVVWNEIGDLKLDNFYTKTEVNDISTALQSEIDILSADVINISANLGSKTFISLTDAPSGGYVNKGNEFVVVNSSETGLAFVPLLFGTIECDTINQFYTISNTKLTVNSLPIVSLTIPTSGDTQFVVSVVDIRSEAFDIVLSDIPIYPGYKINWFSLNNN